MNHFQQVLSIDPRGAEQRETEVLIIGSGIAGLTAALAAAKRSRVLLVCKRGLLDSNTRHAQGGIAVPLAHPDDMDRHITDTLRVGCELADREIVEHVIRRGPAAFESLLARGATFDRTGSEFSRAREGGHSRARVLHAGGDATGLELSLTLVESVCRSTGIRMVESCFIADLLTCEGRCVGAIGLLDSGKIVAIRARSVIIAAGGGGEVYCYTTNPAGATADGMVMALRGGAVLADMEFVQFHPTAMDVGSSPLPLISEALRGEGARLVDECGRRFMDEYHSDGELAPRDVVSRAVLDQLRREGARVFLDIRHWPAGLMEERFPGVTRLCREHGINLDERLIPIRPAAHYMIGGVRVDLDGRTSVPGLLACGEAACTGFHGANRLASNSLLEALVLGETCGAAAAEVVSESEPVDLREVDQRGAVFSKAEPGCDVGEMRRRFCEETWAHIGIHRTASGLRRMTTLAEEALSRVRQCAPSRRVLEFRNIVITAAVIAAMAERRTESRGVHFRDDFPRAHERWRTHLVAEMVRGELVVRGVKGDWGAELHSVPPTSAAGSG